MTNYQKIMSALIANRVEQTISVAGESMTVAANIEETDPEIDDNTTQFDVFFTAHPDIRFRVVSTEEPYAIISGFGETQESIAWRHSFDEQNGSSSEWVITEFMRAQAPSGASTAGENPQAQPAPVTSFYIRWKLVSESAWYEGPYGRGVKDLARALRFKTREAAEHYLKDDNDCVIVELPGEEGNVWPNIETWGA